MENLFELTDIFQESYNQFLEAEAEKDSKEYFKSISESLKDAENAFAILEEYYTFSNKLNTLDEAVDLDEAFDPEAVKTLLFKMYKEGLKDKEEDLATYSSVGGIKKVDFESTKDVSFWKKIVLFIKALITWIKKLVGFVFEKIGSGLLGLKRDTEGKDKVGYSKFEDVFKEKLEGARKVEKFGLLKNSESINKIYEIDAAKIKTIDGLTEAEEVKIKEVTKVVSIDLSKDFVSLQELIRHFFDLFDNAIGSSNENLFGIDDLKILFRIFEQTIQGLKSGNLPAYEINGELSEVDAINANKVKDNLVNTKLNVENLRAAYTETSQRIMAVAETIGHKQLLLGSQVGTPLKMYSAATYEEILKIVRILVERLKDAEKKYKDMEAAKKVYEEIVKKLDKISQSYLAVSNVTFTTVYQRKIADLLQSARYIVQTVSLRLTALGLYIKQLSDMENMLRNLMSISGANSDKSFKKDINLKGKLFSFLR